MKVSQQPCNLLSELVVTVLPYCHFVHWYGKAYNNLHLIWCFEKKGFILRSAVNGKWPAIKWILAGFRYDAI